MTREITTHRVGGLNEFVQVRAIDQPGNGGACHRYKIDVPLLHPVESHIRENSERVLAHTDIHFQEGPIGEFGANGISNESLLAVVIDRLEGFQSGPFACTDNGAALFHLTKAMEILHNRTRNRLARGVEGTSQK